jgi:DNA-binding IclR family transcriptional regulator
MAGVERTFQIVEALQEADGARVTELATNLELPKSTVHRYLTALESQGYVVKKGNEYRLSYRFLALGEHTRHRDKAHLLARKKVSELTRTTEERVQFVVPEQGMGVFVHSRKGERWEESIPDVGRRVRLHASASGKAILSTYSDSRVEEVVSNRGLPEFTANTITDLSALCTELEEIRTRGYSLNDEENLDGFRSVGVPVLSEDTCVGAFSISGPTHRITDEKFHETFPNYLLEAAEDVGIQLSLDDEYSRF